MQDKITKIADHYGLDAQLIKMAEECAEYSAAVLKTTFYREQVDQGAEKKRHFGPRVEAASDAMFKELADVMVLCRQIDYFMDIHPQLKTRIEELTEEKCDRQLRRIADELNAGGRA